MGEDFSPAPSIGAGLDRRQGRTSERTAPMTTLPMIRTRALAATLAGSLALALAPVSTADAAPVRSGHARSGDLDLYYEVHGSGGTPLVVVQGSFCTVEICFGKMLPTLAARRQVILIDQQGHGHTLLAKDHPFTVTQMKQDTIAVMKKLGIHKADVLGYSTGAAVALELAITNPELVNKLVLMSGVYDKAGARKELLAMMPTLTADMMKQTPWYAAYKKVAPRDTFDQLVEKVKTIDDTRSWPEAKIRALKMPVQLIVADSDILYLTHAVKFFQLLGGDVAGDLVGKPRSQLFIVPGATHVTMVFEKSPLIGGVVVDFLEAKTS
jgi:pimeloyl-ACP methyl ester carboxylesterase